jgi:hypothetical protein
MVKTPKPMYRAKCLFSLSQSRGVGRVFFTLLWSDVIIIVVVAVVVLVVFDVAVVGMDE